MSKRSIVIILHSSTITGGAEMAILELSQQLSKHAVLRFIVPTAGTMTDWLRSEGYELMIIPYGWWVNYDKNDTNQQEQATKSLSSIYYITEYLKEVRADLVITNTSVIPWGAVAAASINCAHIWIVHELINGKTENKYFYQPQELLRDIGYYSDLVIANSNSTKMTFIGKIEESKTAIMRPLNHLSSLLKQQDEPLIDSFSFRNDSYKIAIIGRVTEHKGQLQVVESVKRLTENNFDIELVIIGGLDDTYGSKIIEYIKKNNLQENIHIIGHQVNPYKYIKNADIVVSASIEESYGRAVVEAMYLGKPVVSTKSKGSEEVVIHSSNGYLYEYGDVDRLTEYLAKLISNEDLRKKMSVNAKLHASNIIKDSVSEYARSIELILKTKFSQKGNNSFISLIAEYSAGIGMYQNDLKNSINRFSRREMDYQKTIDILQNTEKHLQKEINEIKSSKSWKFIKILSRIMHPKGIIKRVK